MKYLFLRNALMVASPLRDEPNKVEREDLLIDSSFMTSRITGSALFLRSTTVTQRMKTRIASHGTMKEMAIRSEIVLKNNSRVQTERMGNI